MRQRGLGGGENRDVLIDPARKTIIPDGYFWSMD
jgi:hypothetical protein